MTQPTIIYPNRKSEIKLTESRTAPLLELIRQQFEKQIAESDIELAETLKAEWQLVPNCAGLIDERSSGVMGPHDWPWVEIELIGKRKLNGH